MAVRRLGALLALWCLPCGRALPTRVSGGQLLVDGTAFQLKGVCWNPVPRGGKYPEDLDFRGFALPDSTLMARAGVNAVRTYGFLGDVAVLDVLWEQGIGVFNAVYSWGGDAPEVVAERVRSVMHHPAILAWMVGNEWNYNGLNYGMGIVDAQHRVAEVTRLIKETDPHHAVATIYGGLPSMESLTALSHVDLWGINLYNGLDFGDLFDNWAQLSQAPMFVSEFGADAYDARTEKVSERSQARAVRALTDLLLQKSAAQHGGVCVGGTIYELADEWWRDMQGSADAHEVKGFVAPGIGPYPDFTFNQEWWGLVRYDGTPREAFWAYSNVSVPGLRQPSQAQQETNMTQLRLQACGAREACRGRLGYCCPRAREECGPCSGQPEHTAYSEHADLLVPGSFAVEEMEKSDACQGIGECQFLTLSEALEFCDRHEECSGVLRHAMDGDCAGKLGCFTPRHGRAVKSAQWALSGGRTWLKTNRQPAPNSAAAPHADQCLEHCLVPRAPPSLSL